MKETNVIDSKEFTQSEVGIATTASDVIVEDNKSTNDKNINTGCGGRTKRA